MKTILRTLLCAFTLFCANGFAQNIADLPIEDKKLLWEEATATFDGWSYTYEIFTFTTPERAKGCAEHIFQCKGYQPISQKKLTQRLNEIPIPVRQAIMGLDVPSASAPIKTPDADTWSVVHLLDKDKGSMQGVNPQEWLTQYAATSLPPLSELKTQPDLIARRILNRVRRPEELTQAMTEGQVKPEHLDAPLSSGLTPLVRAIYRNENDLIAALIQAGASVDRCSPRACPLSTAILLEKADLVDLLLKHNANPDGGPSAISPLMAAASVGDIGLSRRLISAGANPLAHRMESTGSIQWKRSTLYYAKSDPKYLDWLGKEIDSAWVRSGHRDWSAWIEQGGKRILIKDGNAIKIKREPFNLVVKTDSPDDIRVLASEDMALIEKSKDPVIRREMLADMRISAVRPDGSYLVVSPIQFDREGFPMDFVSNAWGYSPDPDFANGTKKVVKASEVEYVHRLDSLVIGSKDVSMNQYRGSALALVLGPRPEIGSGADLFKPLRFKLTF